MDMSIISWQEFLDSFENSNLRKSNYRCADGCLTMEA